MKILKCTVQVTLNSNQSINQGKEKKHTIFYLFLKHVIYKAFSGYNYIHFVMSPFGGYN